MSCIKGIGALLLASAAALGTGAAAQTRARIANDHGKMEYLLHEPAKRDSGGPCAVIVLIGSNASAAYALLKETVFTAIRAKDRGQPNTLVIEPVIAPIRRDRATQSHALPATLSIQTALVLAMLDSLAALPSINRRRIYVTGFSPPGLGAWELLQRRPGLFAAGVPIGSGGDWQAANRLIKTPLWAHAANPGMRKAIRKAGGELRSTEPRRFDPLVNADSLRASLIWMLEQVQSGEQASFGAYFEQEKSALPGRILIPPKSQFHLYLLIGQSNMAGRGKVEPQDRQPHPRVLALDKNNAWVVAREPLHFDCHYAGVGPGFAFGRTLAQLDTAAAIGLIPCAVGETSIEDWQKDSPRLIGKINIFTNAIDRTRMAMQQGTLKGIIWHQGESNNYSSGLRNYSRLLARMIGDVRSELGAAGVPFVMGELLDAARDHKKGKNRINGIIAHLADSIPATACVSSEGLHGGLHFDTPSYRELGRRYASSICALGISPAARSQAARQCEPLDEMPEE
jgi:hypothetical protein